MTFPVGDVSLDHLIESRESIEREIRQRVRNELSELDERRAVLLALLGEESVAPCQQPPEKKSPHSVVSLAKYRDPETGKTWSGKGKRPRWFEIHRANDFLIAA